MRTSRMLWTVAIALVLVATWQLPSAAQDKAAFAAAQAANAKLLRDYTWKTRTELKLKGESKSVKLEQVRYDAAGALQKTPLGGAPEPKQAAPEPAGRRGGRVKAKVVENKKEEFAELLQNVVALVKSYGQMPPEKLQAFMAGATTKPGTADMPATLQISGKNAMQDGDALGIWIDPATMMMRRVDVTTAYEKKPVTLTVVYQTVTGGPTAMGKVTLAYPDKQVEVTVDNYDYQKVAR
jgi:hypothetical protein